MNRPIKFLNRCVICVIIVCLMGINAYGEGTGPVTNHGKKWRIGYLEGGPYYNYQAILKSMIASLMHSGWIQHASIPKCLDKDETSTLWKFLSTQILSDFIEFPSDGYWSFNRDDAVRNTMKPFVIKRLKDKKDIDLMLAYGTWAGQDLANCQHNTSSMVISASNAVRSGIIKSVEDSGIEGLQEKVFWATAQLMNLTVDLIFFDTTNTYFEM